MKKQLQPLTPAALYARVSSDRQDVDLSVSAQLRTQVSPGSWACRISASSVTCWPQSP